jgi:large subunit ribosomal protein L21
MFVILNISGSQVKIKENDIIRVNSIPHSIGTDVEFDKVLLVNSNGKTNFGAPYISSAIVTASVINHARTDKIIVFKKKRRKGYKRKIGHRQNVTYLKIMSIKV